MKILITGGCGFVGSNIAIFLKKKLKNSNIYSLDNLYRKGSVINRSELLKNGIKNYNIDITNFKKIKALKKFDLVIDCCAEPAIEASVKDPDRVFKTNLIGTFNILKKVSKDKSNIIFLSSSRVYSISSLKQPFKNLNLIKPLINIKKINENFETSMPSSLYGFTKLASEKLIREFSYAYKIKYLINRFGVIAGPWQFGKQDQGFIPLWMAKHFLKKKLSYIGFGGHGNQIRDVIHIDDVSEIIYLQIKRMKRKYNDTFNIGGGIKNTISLKQLTLKCEKITGNKIRIGKRAKTSIFDVPSFVTDNSKIFKAYRWKPKRSIDDILKDVYSWLRQNKNTWSYFK